MTISTSSQLPPNSNPIVPTYRINANYQMFYISLDPLYTNINVFINIKLLMKDGSTHNYKAHYYGNPNSGPGLASDQ